jgi:DNA helicase HerA-like ATPase
VPLTLRHYGKTEEGGFGEAYHGAIFGQSRSGKSVLASQIMTGFAANPQLGILIIDPQGEFARDRFAAGDGRVDFSLHRMLRSLKQPREVCTITTDEVALEGVEAFTELLRRKGVFDTLGFKGANKEREASERMASILGELIDDEGRRRPIRSLTDSDLAPLVADLARFADVIYATRPGTTPGEGQRAADVQNRFMLDRTSLTRRWNETLDHFRTGNGKRLLSDVVQMVLRDREVVILSFAQDSADATPYFLLNEILTRIRHVIHRSFQHGASSNALIMLDEAHLFADETSDETPDRARTRSLLTSSVRLTGKFGIGWLFVTQTISSLSRDLRAQLHVKFFGQGFRVGGDKEYVETELGKEGFQRYASLPDPKRTGRYTFMVTGPIVSLGSLGTPLVLQAYRSSDDLMRTNAHLFPVAQEPADAIELPRARQAPRAPADLSR